MAWIDLAIAGVLEVVWAIALKYTQGVHRLWVMGLTASAMLASLYYLSRALREIPLGTGYAVWTGIGVAGTTILGIALFSEPVDTQRLASVGLIVLGIVGLRLA